MPKASSGRPPQWCGVLHVRATDLSGPVQGKPTPSLAGSAPSYAAVAGAVVPLSPAWP